MAIKTAIILAGGKGTRLRPLTYEIPKALIPVQGRTLTEHVFDVLKKIGVKEVYLSVSYMAEKIMKHYKDGKDFGLDIKYLVEDKPIGTAGPLLILKKQGKQIEEDFIMVNGDNLFNLDLLKKFELHKKNNATATIGLARIEDPSAYGVVRMDGDKILEFIEKPKKEEAPSNLINSGYYILSPKVFGFLPEKDFVMMETDVFPAIAEKGELFGYKDQGQWFDTGTFERWEEVIRNWKGVN